MNPLKIYIGWDPSERSAWNIASWSMAMNTHTPLNIQRLTMADLIEKGLYTRPTEVGPSQLWDVISQAPMSTAHAIARFFVPHLMNYEGWALFVDGDILVRKDIADLFELADPKYAVMVVQHNYQPSESVKKAGHIQMPYPRKQWSSVMLVNASHPAHQRLTLDMLNTVPGRDLHAFCWLEDSEIGSLPEQWNWLVGHSSLKIDPAIVHFTEGLPDKPGYDNVPFADHWRHVQREARQWVGV